VAFSARAAQANSDAAKPDDGAAAAPKDPVWKDKPIPEWTESDAKQILTDSPWVKSVTASVEKTEEKKPAPRIGRQGFGIGGFGRHRAANSDDANGGSGGSSSGSPDAGKSGAPAIPPAPLVLTLRWESALPVREAELKAKDVRAPAVDENHYAIAVYGIPGKLVKDDSKKAAERLKSQAAIKRGTKEDMKPSSVEIVMRDDGPVILYLFSRTNEITWRDHQIEFDAQVGNLKISQSFAADDMRFHGTLEL